MFEELAELDEMIMKLSQRRNEILDIIYPTIDEEKIAEELSRAYAELGYVA